MNIQTSITDLSPSSTAPPLVLVVDESTDTLNLLCKGILAAGYTALSAKNADGALKCLEFVSPDAILLDAASPGIKGFELGRRIKSMPAWADIPILFMIEQAEIDQIISSFENGGNDYILKPLHLPEALARLTTCFATRPATNRSVSA